MTLGDVRPGRKFLSFLPYGAIQMLGRFVTEPFYDEGDSRWTVDVRLPGVEELRSVSLYDLGITPGGDGLDWSEAVTVVLHTRELSS
jgi:hypothetical protein